ncbi:hypothetical protein R6Q59_011228 [Mikania micrantha]
MLSIFRVLYCTQLIADVGATEKACPSCFTLGHEIMLSISYHDCKCVFAWFHGPILIFIFLASLFSKFAATVEVHKHITHKNWFKNKHIHVDTYYPCELMHLPCLNRNNLTSNPNLMCSFISIAK